KTFGQCKKWLDMHLKDVQRIDALSTSKAAEISATKPNSAAISNIMCADLHILFSCIYKIDNTTHFFTICKTNKSTESTGDDKTLLLFTVDHQKPSALCDSMAVFKDHNINLTRPSLQRPWHYVFFVEFRGHKDDEVVKNSLKKLEKLCLNVKVLGSY
ncbi:ACT-like protein, partial [Rhizophagus irregularis]